MQNFNFENKIHKKLKYFVNIIKQVVKKKINGKFKKVIIKSF